MLKRVNNKAQVTIFIIIAIVIIGLIILFFALRGRIKKEVPSEFQPIEESYLSCINDFTKTGVSILGEQAGYIYLPEFEPGNKYSPSSNHLDVLGAAVPYWYYTSGNNIIKEQIPSKAKIEEQLEKYLDENLKCDFSSFINKGFVVQKENFKTDVKISENKISVKVDGNLNLAFGNETMTIKKHEQEVDSKIGKLYNEAVKIYNKEKSEMFLEKYALDTLYLNAPVDGVELSCSPKIWNFENVKRELKTALEENILMIKVKGDYYKKADKYFIADVSSDETASFFYSKDWPTKIETQDEDGILIAEPVGNQQGLGILGFCYVPYHFIYEINFPVLVQLYDGREVFKFPVNVMISGNKERTAIAGSSFGSAESKLCQYKNAEVFIATYDANLEPVEAEISFRCFNEHCSIGKTKIHDRTAVLNARVPQCVNGFIVAKAENYAEKKEMISTNEESSANIILDKLHDTSVIVKLDDKLTEELAVIYFQSNDVMQTMVWPEQKSVKLKEGFYNISAMVYKNSSLRIEGTKTQKCIESIKPGFFGLFGTKEEKCFDIEMPSQELGNAIAGGGKANEYLLEDSLKKGIEIQIESLALPRTIEELQKNYESLETKKIHVEFK